jgi:hypothetical protein
VRNTIIAMKEIGGIWVYLNLLLFDLLSGRAREEEQRKREVNGGQWLADRQRT